MICQATYESLEAIPEALREEFEQKNGKWQLKESAIPGVGPLFNQSIAANAQKAVDQVKKRNERITELEGEVNTLKDRLSVIDTPGAKVLSAGDAETFEAYAKLGTPKEIEAKLKEHGTLAAKVAKAETAEALQKVVSANGLGGVKLNPEVLTDWLTSGDAKGFTAFVKTVETTDAKGQKVTQEVPFVRVEREENGKLTVSEHELLPFAKEKMPEWKYAALTSGAAAAGNGSTAKPAGTAAAATGVRLPDLGSAKAGGTAETPKKRPVDIANEARAKKPSPFANGALGGLTPPMTRTQG